MFLHLVINKDLYDAMTVLEYIYLHLGIYQDLYSALTMLE